MNFNEEPTLQTAGLASLSKNRREKLLSGIETLDLSVADPQPTEHLALAKAGGARFLEKGLGRFHRNAWRLGSPEDEFQVRLSMPEKHGLTFTIELSPTGSDNPSDSAVLINVNGHEWEINLDPRILKFHKNSWYLPHYLLEKGKNLITLSLAPSSDAQVLLKSVSIMRFDIQSQHPHEHWCWAAVTASFLDFFDQENNLTQCQVVKECFSQTDGFETEVDCCLDGENAACDRPFKIIDALDTMGLFSSRCNYPLTLKEIREQIDMGAPVALRIEWRKGGGHFVVITAVGPPHKKGDSHTWLRVADPLDQAASYISYATLKNRYKGNGKWTHTYLFEKERERRQRREARRLANAH